MDFNAFKTLVDHVKDSKSNLMQLRIEAREKGELDREEFVLEVLDDLHPGWDVSPCDVGKAAKRPGVSVSFKESSRHFDHAIDGYAWMMEQFIQFRRDESAENLARIPGTTKNRPRLASSPNALFPISPDLVKKHARRLRNGMYLDTNLSNDEKFDVLLKLGMSFGLEFDRDWKWQLDDQPSLDELLRLL